MISFTCRKEKNNYNTIHLFSAVLNMSRSKRKHNVSDIFYTDCDTGYYEYLRLCKMCPYPSFGTDCQYICDCQNETCNHITGCQDKISTEGTLNFK